MSNLLAQDASNNDHWPWLLQFDPSWLSDSIDATPVAEDIPDYYQRGKDDCANGEFVPPSCMSLNYDNYIRGFNDQWAAVNKRTLLR